MGVYGVVLGSRVQKMKFENMASLDGIQGHQHSTFNNSPARFVKPPRESIWPWGLV
jgi:hypothetical protein